MRIYGYYTNTYADYSHHHCLFQGRQRCAVSARFPPGLLLRKSASRAHPRLHHINPTPTELFHRVDLAVPWAQCGQSLGLLTITPPIGNIEESHGNRSPWPGDGQHKNPHLHLQTRFLIALLCIIIISGFHFGYRVRRRPKPPTLARNVPELRLLPKVLSQGLLLRTMHVLHRCL